VGQEVRDGNFSFVITGVERVDSVAGSEFPDLQKAAQGEYVVVKMVVTNDGTEPPQTFFASFNKLSDGSTVYIVFDVPKGTDVESIELHDGPFSDAVTVGL
jgi:hypothetical protein